MGVVLLVRTIFHFALGLVRRRADTLSLIFE